MNYTSKEDYNEKFVNIIDDSNVQCPLCLHRGKLLSKHMKTIHGISNVEEFRDKFPNYAICTYDVYSQRKQNGRNTIKNYGIAFLKKEKQRIVTLNTQKESYEIKELTSGVLMSERCEKEVSTKQPKMKFSTFEEYSEHYMNVPTEDIVMCPLCNYIGLKLSKHLKDCHEMGSAVFKKIYPEYALLSYKFYKIHSSGAINNLNKYGQSKATEGKLKSEKFHKQKSEQMAELCKRNHADREFRKRVYGPKNGNLIEYYSEVLKRYVFLRSTFELHVLEALETEHITYTYEKLRIPYMFENTEHVYYPDFYLPEYNLIIEVKPSLYCQNQLFSLKKLASLNQGYKFLLVDESIEYSHEKIIEAIKSV